MTKGIGNKLTDLARVFLQPSSPTHRQYEALRAFFVEHLPAQQAAQRFGYSYGSFRVLCHQFRHNPQRLFFLTPPKGPRHAPKRDAVRERLIALRKQNYSIYDIQHALQESGHPLSPAAIAQTLREEGFARLPRRSDEERPPALRPTPAAVADVQRLDLSPRSLRTRFGGLFLFLPFLAPIPLQQLLGELHFPGSRMVPASAALRSLLALKLFGSARHSHVMSSVFDEGLALFAGLNVIPKRSFLTEYSCRIPPACYPAFMKRWFETMAKLGIDRGNSFDLDFHTIPYHGDDALVEKHYVSRRSRRQKGILAFLAQDADTRVFCYANASLRKPDQNDEILRFAEFWKQRTGQWPQELIFDSKLTTHAHLNRLNELGIQFITLRRRSPQMLHRIHQVPLSAWRRVELKGVTREYRTPRILDQKITLSDYTGLLRQMVITDLGHEEPTFLLTNQLSRSAPQLIARYAQRMIIENGIADSIDFFHMDALSSAVAMKVDCDLQLTLMASSLYRLFALRLQNGYQRAHSRHLFRDFIDATAQVSIGDAEVEVRFQKRAHNPLLLAAGFDQLRPPIPWLDNKRLRLTFG
jgi:Transposase DDE domain